MISSPFVGCAFISFIHSAASFWRAPGDYQPLGDGAVLPQYSIGAMVLFVIDLLVAKAWIVTPQKKFARK
jgi:hypothetical protein